MLKNYFIVAWRNFRHNKIFSLINVLGLSIGISAALVIFLIVQYEFSFDRFEKDGDRIYRVVTAKKFAGTPYFNSGVPAPLPPAVKQDVSGIEETVGFHETNGRLKITIPQSKTGKQVIFKAQQDIIYADDSYFRLIPYQWLAGSPQSALTGPFKVVLTEERARAYFPDRNLPDLIGKQIIYDDSTIATVTGIVKRPDKNSDFNFKEFISQATIPAGKLTGHYGWDEWGTTYGGSQLFIRLSAGSSAKQVEHQLAKLLMKYNKTANASDGNSTNFHLQPLNDLHFNSQYSNFGDHTAHKPTLYGLLIVAAFLLLLGCINFINLSTAQSLQRAKEIGIRKTLGGSRKQLVFQFLNETFFITVIATVLSILITPLLLRVFADFIPKDLHFDLLNEPALIFFLIGLVIVVTLLSGFYPALVLSGYKPVLVLKNQGYSGTSGTRKTLLRKGLTVSQFFIAQVFIMATLVTTKQIHYMLNKDLGFRKDAIVLVHAPFKWDEFNKPGGKRFALLNELRNIPGVQQLSLGSGAPSSAGWSSQTLTFADGKKNIETDARVKSGDTNFFNLYNIKLLAGRNVQPSDTTKEYIINETYMHILGYQKPRDILNKLIEGKPIVAVMADFNQESLHATVKPLAYSSSISSSYVYSIALRPQDAGNGSWKTTLGKIEKVYKNIYPEEDFSYEFFDESIAKYYKSEQNISGLLKWAAGLAIFISCMGLLGLVIFTTNLRTREIGVRKVLGASVANIVSIISKDFVALVLLAFVVAVPLAWWVMSKWLENFAYRTTISWWVFLASGAIMMIIAFITLSIQTIRAANANPVQSLRNE